MLTQEDLKQIKEYLFMYGKKDSQLERACTPLTGYEQVAIVQNGANKIVPLSEIQETIGIELKKDVLKYSDYLSLPDKLANTLYVCTTEDDAVVVQMFLGELPLLPTGAASLSSNANPNVIFEGEETQVTLTAEASPTAYSIRIKHGNTTIAEGVNKTTISGIAVTASSTNYIVQASIMGSDYSQTINVTAVNPIYYGSGNDLSNFLEHKVRHNMAVLSPLGTYKVIVRNAMDYVFFAVPENMNVTRATMSGFDFPLESPINVTINGKPYKYYRSSNKYDASNLNIVLL